MKPNLASLFLKKGIFRMKMDGIALTAQQKLILAYLAAYASDDGYYRKPPQFISAELDIPTVSCEVTLRKLNSLGLICVARGEPIQCVFTCYIPTRRRKSRAKQFATEG